MKKYISYVIGFVGMLYAVMPAFVQAQAVVTATNVRLNSASGTRLVVQGGISFTGTSNFIDNGRVDILTNPLGPASNWNDATASGVYDATSTGHVFFSATGLQTITGLTSFYDLTMNGATGISLAGDIEIRDNLFLNGGLFTTGANKVYVSNPALNAIQTTFAGGLNNAAFPHYINGMLERAANIVSTPAPYSNGYIFPVGKQVSSTDYYAPVYFNKTNTNTTRYTTEYFLAAPFDRTNVLRPPIDHVSFNEYWHITSTTAGGSPDDDAFVSLSWRDISNVSTSALSRDSLLVAHYRNNGGMRWEPEFNALLPPNVSGNVLFGFVTSNVSVGSFVTAPNNERRFTLATRAPSNVLPFTRFEWNATALNNTALLSWDVENDVSIKQYEAERSENGIYFTTINSTPSKKLSGTSYYNFTDNNPVNGWNYYRIRITELNGQVTYSTVKKLNFSKNGIVKIYPNPASTVLNLQLEQLPLQGAVAQIVDVTGRIYYQTPVTKSAMQLNVSKLLPGSYFIRYVSNGEIQSFKFIKINP
jgi:Secretion system C-terminal sorting domain